MTNDPQTTDRDAELCRELLGTVCRCRRNKQARESLCKRCYFALPPAMRRALYLRFGEGYREAYEAAAELLDRRDRAE